MWVLTGIFQKKNSARHIRIPATLASPGERQRCLVFVLLLDVILLLPRSSSHPVQPLDAELLCDPDEPLQVLRWHAHLAKVDELEERLEVPRPHALQEHDRVLPTEKWRIDNMLLIAELDFGSNY